MEGRELTFRHNLPKTKIERYWKELENNTILATRCSRCGEKYYPPQADCSVCYSDDMEWVEIRGEGTLESFTQQHVIPQGFTFVSKPYTIAIARFGEYRVMGWYEGDELPKIGEKVEAYTAKDETGISKVYFRRRTLKAEESP